MTARRTGLPREVADLLRDDPELVQLADRVLTMPERHRSGSLGSRRLLTASVAGALVAAVAVVVTVLASGRSTPSLSDRALAAVDAGPVLHAVVVRNVDDDRTVELATGREVPARLTVEWWFDEGTRQLHVIERRNGAILANALGARRSVLKSGWRLDPALALFSSGYRRALRDGRLRDEGVGVFHGRSVRWLAFATGERVAVDARTYKPVAIEQPAGTRWRVAELEAVRRSAADFRPPQGDVGASDGELLTRRRATIPEAVHALRLPVLWLGRGWDDLRLRSASVERLRTRYAMVSDLPAVVSPGVTLEYQGRNGVRIKLREARRPLPAYGFSSSRTFAFDPIPPAGSMQLTQAGGWLGQFRMRGLYVSLMGPAPTTVLEAATALRPTTG